VENRLKVLGVEEYHESLKQNASMGKSSTKTPTTQTTHFFAPLLAYSKAPAWIGSFSPQSATLRRGLKSHVAPTLHIHCVTAVNNAMVNKSTKFIN
jgi:hypothetical protein